MSSLLDGLNWSSLKQNAGDAFNNTKKSYADDRFWKLSRDANDTGSALIRLLPDLNHFPATILYKHSAKKYDATAKKGFRWLISNCAKTVDSECPICDKYWTYKDAVQAETNEVALKAIKDEQAFYSRKIQHVTNILVINDPANPQNNGKTFLWEFGIKLMEKFEKALAPSETDKALGKTAIELFNPLIGANVLLSSSKGNNGFINYDATTIEAPTAIVSTEQEALDLIARTHALAEFQSIDYFEDADEVRKKINYFENGSETGTNPEAIVTSASSPMLSALQIPTAVPEVPNTVQQTVPLAGASIVAPVAPTLQPLIPQGAESSAIPAQPVVNNELLAPTPPQANNLDFLDNIL